MVVALLAAIAVIVFVARPDSPAAAVGFPTSRAAARPELIPFADRYARCQSMVRGSTAQRRCLVPAVRELERGLSAARGAGASREELGALETRLLLARSDLRAPAPTPAARRRFSLSPAQVTLARRIMARDRILARIAGDQRITLQDIGPAQDERGTFGAFAIVGWPRPVTLRDFAWPRLGGCQDGRPFRGSRRVRVPLVSDLSQAAVTIDLRLGRVVVIQSGPDQLGAASPSTAPTPLTPGPEGLVLGPNDFSIAHVVSTTSSFGSFVEEGMSQSLFCALGPVGRIAGHGVVLRPADGSPGLVVSAVIVTESPAAARRLVRLARPLARFMDIRPRAIAAPRQVGDHADAYVATALSAEGRPSGPAVVWTHGRLVGAVFQTGAGAAALDALLGLADAQEARMAAAAG